MQKILFYSFLGILLWLPLPEGSKPYWAMMVLCLLIYAHSAFTVVAYASGRIELTPTFRKAWPFHLGFALICSWLWLQQLPISIDWLQSISPKSDNINQLALSALTDNGQRTTASVSLDAYSTRLHAMLTTAYYLLFCLALIYVNSRRRLEQLLLTLVAVGTFQALFGVLSTLSGMEILLFRDKPSYFGVATGTFVNRNSFAGSLEMTMAAGMGLLISRLGDSRAANWREWMHGMLQTLMSNKVLLRSALAIMVVGMVVSRSRMGNTAFFSSLMMTGLIYVICRRKLSRGMVILFASLLVIDIAIVSQWFGLEKVIQRLESSSVERETRPNVSMVTLDMIQDYPLTGSGAGSYYTTLPKYHDGSWRGFYDLAHNDYLQFPAELGLPAYVVLGLMVLCAYAHAIQTMRRRRRKVPIGAAFAAAMGITALMIHSTVDFNLQIPANAAYFVLLLAVALVARYVDGGSLSVDRSPLSVKSEKRAADHGQRNTDYGTRK